MINKFTPGTLFKMRKLLYSPEQIEQGFALCKSQNGISSGEICYGSECEIDVRKSKCNSESEAIGAFHTHPARTKQEPSINDLLLPALGSGIECIGFKGIKKIKCYSSKEKEFTKINMLRLATQLSESSHKIENMVSNRKISRSESIRMQNDENNRIKFKALSLFNVEDIL